MDMEKGSSPIHKKQGKSIRTKILYITLAFAYTFLFIVSYKGTVATFDYLLKAPPHDPDSLCPLVKKLDPNEYLNDMDKAKMILLDEEYKAKSIEKLSGAVKVPTEVYDEMIHPDGAETKEELYQLEPLWKNFETLHDYLAKTFPLVHKNLKLDKVNKFALVYTWEGTDKTKKPLMLTAHQDVVPVQKETIDKWTFPPFEGKVKDGYITGRGACDCKSLLIGLLETVELLLSEGNFTPERSVILAFGYDEESAGTGAENIAKFLLDKYGPESMYAIIDEGTAGFDEVEGTKVIAPATGEKGYVDSFIELITPGGHSSVPPPHTLIGIMSKLIDIIESNPYDSILSNANPVLGELQCLAEHATLDKSLKSDILKAHIDVKANENVIKYLSKEDESKFLITTSQATDIIKGGVKSNALPEHVSVLINHRIAVEETVKLTTDKILKDIQTIASKFDLGIIMDNLEIVAPTDNGYFNYSLLQALEPSPVTPLGTEVANNFGGALRYLYEDLIYPESNDTFVFAPYLSTGNTDTKSYWDLTPHIFRYEPAVPADRPLNIHSVDENCPIDGYFLIVAFYHYYIQMVSKFDD